MGLLTDLVVADVAEAQEVLAAPNHEPRWPALDTKGIDYIYLSVLAFILKGQAADADSVVAYSQQFTELASGGEDGPWVFQLPQDLVSGLTAIQDSALPTIADQWSKSDEMQAAGANPSDLIEALTAMRALASEAVAKGKALLLWMCL